MERPPFSLLKLSSEFKTLRIAGLLGGGVCNKTESEYFLQNTLSLCVLVVLTDSDSS